MACDYAKEDKSYLCNKKRIPNETLFKNNIQIGDMENKEIPVQ